MAKKRKTRGKINYKRYAYPYLVPPTYKNEGVALTKEKQIELKKERNRLKNLKRSQQVTQKAKDKTLAKAKKRERLKGSYDNTFSDFGFIGSSRESVIPEVKARLKREGLVYVGDEKEGVSFEDYFASVVVEHAHRRGRKGNSDQYYQQLLISENFDRVLVGRLAGATGVGDMWLEDRVNNVIDNFIQRGKNSRMLIPQAEYEALQGDYSIEGYRKMAENAEFKVAQLEAELARLKGGK